MACARMHPHLDQIHDEVTGEDEHCVEKDSAHDEIVVPVEGGVHKELADAGDEENGFHYEGSADQPRDGGPEVGDDRI